MGFLTGMVGATTPIYKKNENAKGLSREASTFVGMKSGETVKGQVVQIKDGQITVRMENGEMVQAKLQEGMDLQPGQKVLFAVRDSQGATVTLSPMFTNLAYLSTAESALSQANLPITEQNLSMVEAMLRGNLSIDVKSLLSMVQEVSTFEAYAPADIVSLKFYGLSINENNLESFQSFRSYENQLTQGMQEILEQSTSYYMDLFQQGKPEEAVAFVKGMLKALNPSGAGEVAVEGSINDRKEGLASVLTNTSLTNSVTETPNAESALTNSASEAQNAETALSEFTSMDAAKTKTMLGASASEQSLLSETIREAAFADSFGDSAAELPLKDLGAKTMQTNLWQKLPMGAKAELIELLRIELPKEPGLDILRTEQGTLQDFFKHVTNVLEHSSNMELLEKLISKKSFGDGLRGLFTEQWTMQPAEAGEKASVMKLYDTLNSQLSELGKQLASLVPQQSPIAASLGQMQQNIDFMQQMNQMYQYIQLPLRMQGGETTGDLFVYTNKKNLAQKDGEISALLHLDMPNLGPLDVYTALHGNHKVTTTFTLAEEADLAFIEKNIHILEERLAAKGYDCNTKFQKRESKAAGEGIKREGVISNSLTGDMEVLGHLGFHALA